MVRLGLRGYRRQFLREQILDVSRIRLERFAIVALAAILVLGLVLRLRGIHDPILDHPGWRQGDTAAIARSFATRDFNPFHPQVDYNGPPPNYVELELQIVPWLAACAYKLFGVHEIFGRLVSIGFSLGTVAVLYAFARWLFASRVAALVAALAFAIYPGSTYYGRTFMPDTTMTFFLTAAIFACARWAYDDDARFGRRFVVAAALTALAILAKPVALVGLVPIAAMLVASRGVRALVRAPAAYAFPVAALVPYLAYDRYVSAIAEWHWASGITRLHVVPSLAAAFTSREAFLAKLGDLGNAWAMLASTMIGRTGLIVALAAIVLTTVWRAPSRSRAVLWAWLAAAIAYAYVVVTVERVDYYLYVFLPLAALWTGGLAEACRRTLPTNARRVAAILVALVASGAVLEARAAVAPYYRYKKNVYRNARALDASLAPGAIIVMGHYDPSVMYYINRKGWEEDPYAWTPFDEQSAIRKGARYFIAVERRRFERNVELHAWLQRFPVRNPDGAWPVYETDPAKIVPGAEARWKAFRRAEKAGTLRRRTRSIRAPS
ncbi:MAG: glycosyltransferase family 39 protein [Vulcanimicrobiaceae bacterium]